MAEWLRRLTRKPKVRTAVGSNPTLDSLVAVRYTSPGRPEPCEGNLVAVAGSCGGVMVKHPWPLLEISLSDFRGLATLNINTYLPTYLGITCLLSDTRRGTHVGFHLKFPTHGSAPNLNSGRWVSLSEFLSQLKKFELTLHPQIKKISVIQMGPFVKVQIHVESRSWSSTPPPPVSLWE